jgi:ubiquinone/menaquinone biosynthesis C-methylase UbiE
VTPTTATGQEATIAAAYSAAGARWQAGPGAIYDRLATELVARCPGGVEGRRVLDLGAGTGAASRAALAAGASSVIAVDAAAGMLAHEAARRPPAAVGDAVALPLATATMGAVVAAYSLNHLDDPARGLVEAARTLEPGGGLIASAYAEEDGHPVKAAVEAACAERGWHPEGWYRQMRTEAVPRLATVERAREAAAVLPGATVAPLRVAFPALTARDLVRWRLGMAQVATFLAGLDERGRAAVADDALERLGEDPPVLVRSSIMIAWQAPGGVAPSRP